MGAHARRPVRSPLLHFAQFIAAKSIMTASTPARHPKSSRLWPPSAARAIAHTVAALTLSLPAVPLFAQSTPAALVNPGQWEITPQSNAGATVSYALCFARGDLDDLKQLLPNLSNIAGCPPQRTGAADGVMTWEFDCPAQSFRGDGRYTLGASAVDGVINFTQGAPAVTSSQRITARQTGACPARQVSVPASPESAVH